MTLTALRSSLRDAPNLSQVARDAACSVRTIYRIRDGEFATVSVDLFERVIAALRKDAKARKRQVVRKAA